MCRANLFCMFRECLLCPTMTSVTEPMITRNKMRSYCGQNSRVLSSLAASQAFEDDHGVCQGQPPLAPAKLAPSQADATPLSPTQRSSAFTAKSGNPLSPRSAINSMKTRPNATGQVGQPEVGGTSSMAQSTGTFCSSHSCCLPLKYCIWPGVFW